MKMVYPYNVLLTSILIWCHNNQAVIISTSMCIDQVHREIATSVINLLYCIFQRMLILAWHVKISFLMEHIIFTPTLKDSCNFMILQVGRQTEHLLFDYFNGIISNNTSKYLSFVLIYRTKTLAIEPCDNVHFILKKFGLSYDHCINWNLDKQYFIQ